MELITSLLHDTIHQSFWSWSSGCFYFLILLCLWSAWMRWKRSHNTRRPLPPSPVQLPFVGCLPFLSSLPHETFSKWAKKLGKIYSCRLGGKTVIVLNDADLIREALSQPVFNGRPHMYTAEITSKGHGMYEDRMKVILNSYYKSHRNHSSHRR